MFFFRYGQTILTTTSSQRIVPVEISCQRIVPTLSKNCPYPVKELSLTGQRIVPITPLESLSYQYSQTSEKKKGFRKILERRKEPVFLL